VNENEKKLERGNAWWIPAVSIFSEVSAWIAVPIILALIAGKALDKHYGTKPTFLLIMAGVGFLVTAYGIVKSVRNYVSKMKK
jgi:F0F1-type ATP synthase assembly protein I